MKIGVLGYGTVGSSVCNIISEQTHNCGISNEIEIKYILRSKFKADGNLMVDDPKIILNDPEVELIVDALPGIYPSYEYIKEALTHGKHVVSANKAALAFNFNELVCLANKHNAALMYEAACGGAVPIIHEVSQITKSDKIHNIYGILNGTSNYILYNMYKNNMDFDKALLKAQELGYAEADPSADIDGTDVRNKAILLADTAWNTDISSSIETIGISEIKYEQIRYFEQKNKIIKLMMLGKKSGSNYKVYVIPTVLSNTLPEANIADNINIVTLETEFAGKLSICGLGAGGNPTASAILRDIADILNCIKQSRSPSYLNPVLSDRLNENNDLFIGTVYIGNKVYNNANPHDFINEAKAKKIFFAFEPKF